eukprot:jgi/Chlat1/2107/Chrsp17S02698
MARHAVLLILLLCTLGIAAHGRSLPQPAKSTSGRLVEEVIPLQVAGGHALEGNAASSEAQQYSGYFKLDRTHDARMFYFFFESRGNKDKDPLVLWMTGGPGCSSEIAVFYENGPWTINEDMTLNFTKYGWDTAANMIFVDQPINTGFSYSLDPRDVVHNEKGVAEDMYDFLQEFLAVHPSLAGRDFFITGESYAGHYVPAVAYRVWKGNKDLAKGLQQPSFTANHTEWKHINMKATSDAQGIAIGNGLTDPEIQYGAYADFARDNGLINNSTYHLVQAQGPGCKRAIHLCGDKGSALLCLYAVQRCNAIVAEILMAAGNINVYDIREECKVPPLCYDFERADRYLNLPEVRQALGVGEKRWTACSAVVHASMMADWMHDYEPIIPPMLEDGVRVLIYAGEADFICNYVGNQRWVSAMPWSGQQEYNAARERKWTVDGQYAGLARAAKGLTFLRIAAAGHMVPMDQPKNALEMLKAFVKGQQFASSQGMVADA